MPRWLKDGDYWAGAALSALGLAIVVMSQKWDLYGSDGPGPAMFPTFYGTAIILLSLIMVVNRIREPVTDEAASPTDWSGVRRALSTWVAFAMAIALMTYIGFTISFGLFTLFLVLVVFGKSFVTALTTAVVTAGLFYLAFPVLLGLELPGGMVGF